MDLGSLLQKKDKAKVESFWSVIIEPRSVQAAVWRIVGEKAEIVSRSVPAAWELSDELITSTDSVLTSAMQDLSDDDPDPEKTVFGVVSSWVVNGQIEETHLEEIRQVCSELSLKPAGFVVLSEAISNLVKSEEGSPLSGVILGVSKDTLELSIFKLGNLLGSTEIARSISVAEDVAEGLTRFADSKSIPSRFLLYGGKEGELEEIRQELIKANWDDYEKIKFLHTPHIEIITPDRKLDAVSLAGAVDIANVSMLVRETETIDEEEKLSESNLSENDDNVESIQPEELGFALGADITHAICQAYGVEHPEAGVAFRAAFLVDKQGIVRAQLVNDLPLGRNIDELVRLVEALQFHERHGEVCPAGWQQGDKGMTATPEGVAKYLSQYVDSL